MRKDTSLFERHEGRLTIVRLFINNLEREINLNNMIKVSDDIGINRHIKTDQTGNHNSSHIFKNIEKNINSFRDFLIFSHKENIIKIRFGFNRVRTKTWIRDLKQDNTNKNEED